MRVNFAFYRDILQINSVYCYNVYENIVPHLTTLPEVFAH